MPCVELYSNDGLIKGWAARSNLQIHNDNVENAFGLAQALHWLVENEKRLQAKSKEAEIIK